MASSNKHNGFTDDSFTTPATYINCVAKDCYKSGFESSNYDEAMYYNCTAINNLEYGFLKSGNSGTDTLWKNCVAYGNGLGDFGDTGTAGISADCSNNASGDSSVTTLSIGTITGIVAGDFKDYPDDLSLSSGSALIDQAENLSWIFVEDIVGLRVDGILFENDDVVTMENGDVAHYTE